MYKERNEQKRQIYLDEIADIPEDSIVYVDESGINEYLYREYCYALPRAKIIAEIAGKKFKRTNIIAGYISGSTIAELVYAHNTDKEFIEEWVEKCLIKELKKGQTVVWDNASFHKSAKVKKMIKDAGCKLIFLPPYSPDLNPIEHFWANLKRYIRKIIATCNTLWEAIVKFFKNYDKCNSSKPA